MKKLLPPIVFSTFGFIALCLHCESSWGIGYNFNRCKADLKFLLHDPPDLEIRPLRKPTTPEEQKEWDRRLVRLNFIKQSEGLRLHAAVDQLDHWKEQFDESMQLLRKDLEDPEMVREEIAAVREELEDPDTQDKSKRVAKRYLQILESGEFNSAAALDGMADYHIGLTQSGQRLQSEMGRRRASIHFAKLAEPKFEEIFPEAFLKRPGVARRAQAIFRLGGIASAVSSVREGYFERLVQRTPLNIALADVDEQRAGAEYRAALSELGDWIAMERTLPGEIEFAETEPAHPTRDHFATGAERAEKLRRAKTMLRSSKLPTMFREDLRRQIQMVEDFKLPLDGLTSFYIDSLERFTSL